jgi:transcriptional regulator with XRE-family HTH domain
MNDLAVGRACRRLRRRLGWRQVDVASPAGVSQSLVSLVERGQLSAITLGTLRKVMAILEAEINVSASWRGGELDRLLDEDHARLVGTVVGRLQRLGWVVTTEVTFSVFGERGSIDILAWHPATRTLLVVEVKTELISTEETLRRFDVKVRLAPDIGKERFGSRPAAIGRVLVFADTATNRRRVARQTAALRASYPAGSRAVTSWIRRPAGTLAALAFVTVPDSAPGRGGSRRVRVPRAGGVAP